MKTSTFCFIVYTMQKLSYTDRTLTDMRSRYDPTEAFIDGWNRSRSNWYSKKLYDKCVKCIELKTRGSFCTQTLERMRLEVRRSFCTRMDKFISAVD